MRLPAFTLHQPQTIAEVVKLASLHAGQFDFVAGGTDLLVNYKQGLNPKAQVISLSAVKELKMLSPGKEVRLGAGLTLKEIAESKTLQESFPALCTAASSVASPLIREQATLGGNLLLDTRCFYFNQGELYRQSLGFCLKACGSECHVVPQKEKCYATYSGDTAPVLIALRARIVLHGPEGKRELSLKDFYCDEGIQRFQLKAGELLSEVILPEGANKFKTAYQKLRLRESFDFPEVGVAVALAQKQKSIEGLRIVITGVSSAPKDFAELTQSVVGKEFSKELIAELSQAIAKASKPVKNLYFNPAYRKKMVAVYTRRALEALLSD